MTDSVRQNIASESTETSSGIWASVRKSMRGSQRDYTVGPIGQAILALSVPMVLEMAMESIFAVCDVFFVAKLGADAVATVGLTESILTIAYTMAMGLSFSITAMVARRIGEQDNEGAALAAGQSILLGLGIAVTLGVLGAVMTVLLLRVMGASPGVLQNGVNYTRVMLGGNVSVMLLFIINAVFRGAGNAALAMRTLWFANIINIILGPCLIFGIGPFPRLGVTGAAVATTIGRGSGALLAFWQLVNSDGRVRLRWRHLRLHPNIMMRLVRLSASGTLQVFIGMASWIGLLRILSHFGSDALAGYTIGIRIILFALLPSWGMSNAAATMVGQALGAKKPERAERAVWLSGFYNMCFLCGVGFIFELFAGPLVRLFTSDPEIGLYASNCLRVVACGFPFYGYGMVLTRALNGAGDMRTPTLINLFVFWVWEIPLAYALAVLFEWGPSGVFIAIMIAFSTLAVVSAVVFKRGRWKSKMV
jgi:putative MATE family efflux protein